MIRRYGECARDQKEAMRGGSGTIRFEHLLEAEKDEFYGKGRLFSKIFVEPGCSIGYHVHEGEMESYYVVRGCPTYSDNGVETELRPGDVTLTLDGEGHGVENRGDETAEIIALILYK